MERRKEGRREGRKEGRRDGRRKRRVGWLADPVGPIRFFAAARPPSLPLFVAPWIGPFVVFVDDVKAQT